MDTQGGLRSGKRLVMIHHKHPKGEPAFVCKRLQNWKNEIEEEKVQVK